MPFNLIEFPAFAEAAAGRQVQSKFPIEMEEKGG